MTPQIHKILNLTWGKFIQLEDMPPEKLTEKFIDIFIEEATLEEREACAKVADNLAERLIKKYNPRQDSMIMTAVNIAQEIRDRSNDP